MQSQLDEAIENGLPAGLVEAGILVIGRLLNDDGKRHVPQADGHLHEVLLAKGVELRRVTDELVIVEDKRRGLGIGHLRVPVGVGHLAQGEGTIVGRARFRAAAHQTAGDQRPEDDTSDALCFHGLGLFLNRLVAAAVGRLTRPLVAMPERPGDQGRPPGPVALLQYRPDGAAKIACGIALDVAAAEELNVVRFGDIEAGQRRHFLGLHGMD